MPLSSVHCVCKFRQQDMREREKNPCKEKLICFLHAFIVTRRSWACSHNMQKKRVLLPVTRSASSLRNDKSENVAVNIYCISWQVHTHTESISRWHTLRKKESHKGNRLAIQTLQCWQMQSRWAVARRILISFHAHSARLQMMQFNLTALQNCSPSHKASSTCSYHKIT